jgi:small subunit ribosomal protein S10
MIRLKIRSFDHKTLDAALRKIASVASVISGPVPLPTKTEKFTVNKSTFVHKTAREQYEMRTHTRILDIEDKDLRKLSSLTLPSGIDIEIKT